MKQFKTKILFLKTYHLYFTCLALLLSRCNTAPAERPVTKKPVDTLPLKAVKKDTIVTPLVVNKDTSYLEYVFANYNLVNIASLDSTIQVDLRYAGTSNFLKRDMYDGLRNAYFNCDAAVKLCNAQYYLKQVNPALSLVVLDAARPQHVQQLMWDSLNMPPDLKHNYLSPPYETSMHNYGCAADVTIMDLATHKELDMGSGYDFFGKISEPVYEAKFLKTGELSDTAYKNRILLRRVMKKAKFNGINSEWWHFSMCSKLEAMAKFKLIK